MIEKNYNYIEGSVARKLEYDVYEDNQVLKAKKQYKDNRKHKAMFVLSLVAILFAGIIVMGRFATITQMSYNIRNSEKAYDDIKNQNAILRLKIEKATNLENIRQVATTKLGMQNPDKSQKVYISVPRNDYTVVMDTVDDEAGSGMGMLKGFLKDSVAGVTALLTR